MLEAVMREAAANMLGYGDGLGRRVGGVGGPRHAHDVLLGPDMYPCVPGLDPPHEAVLGGDPRLGGGGLLLCRSWPTDDGELGDEGFGRRGIR
jgi:hypothetical protein